METTNRKEKIKNIAIIFLIIMLLLTLFSNTIMNRSLVEVSTQMIVSDSLTSKVRGSGYVESSDGYAVTISETRKINTVDVKTGAAVEKGDVLFTLTDAESEELLAKRKAVADGELAYEKNIITNSITVEERKLIEAGKIGSLTDKQNLIAQSQATVEAAQKAYDDLVKTSAATTNVDASAELAALNAAKENEAAPKAAYEAAQTEWQAAKDNLATKSEAHFADPSDGNKEAEYNQAIATETAARTKCVTAEKNMIAYANAVDAAQKAYNAKLSESGTDTYGPQLEAAKATLDAAKANLEKLRGQLTTQMDLCGEYQALQAEKKKLEEMEKSAVGAQITSPIAGTVSEIHYTAGQTVQPEEVMMTIQPENKAYILRFTVTADQSKKIQVGNEATIVNNWWGDDVHARVMAIKKSATDKSQCEVVCELTGEDVKPGSNYTLSIGERSSNYDLIVPTSSVREDANGKYILTIESKSTPLGNRYYARRVAVEVVASDDNNSAIVGAVEAYGYVITTTTKPVEENQQVRLQD